MHKNATKWNETLSKWCKNKYGALKIIDTLETYHRIKRTKKESDREANTNSGRNLSKQNS
jgi:hypothetical protein